MNASEKTITACATQRVVVTLELTMTESWAGTVTLDQIARDAERVAEAMVSKLLAGHTDVRLVRISAPSCVVTKL